MQKKAYELAPLDAATVGHISYILTISGQGCNEPNEVKSKYKVDKDACYRLEWGGELAKLGNKLDAVSSLSFDNYGLGFYYYEVKDFEKMLAIYEAVPTPDFHWWNYNMGVAHHYLGNTNKANEHFSVIKPLYGKDPINTMLEGMKMWNSHIGFQEYIKFELKNKYGYS